MARLPLDDDVDVVMDAVSLTVIKPIKVNGRVATWDLRPDRWYIVVTMSKSGNKYDVWAYLAKVPKDGTMEYLMRNHFYACSVASGVGKAIKRLNILGCNEEWVPELIN